MESPTATRSDATPVPFPVGISVSDGITPAVLCESLRDNEWWSKLVLILIVGAIGGLIFELISTGGVVEWPHKAGEKGTIGRPDHISALHAYDLGFVGRVLIGSTAAVLVTSLVSPLTPFGLLTMALIAGSAGTAIYGTVQARLLATITTTVHHINAQDTLLMEKLLESPEGGSDDVRKAEAAENASQVRGIVKAMNARNSDFTEGAR